MPPVVTDSPGLVEWVWLQDTVPESVLVLLEADEPHLAECAAVAATLAHVLPVAADRGVMAPARHEERIIREYLPMLAGRGHVVMLLAIASVADGGVAQAASGTAERLIRDGAPLPGWARVLREPVAIEDCARVDSPAGDLSELICVFDRGGCSQAVRISVDEHRCGAAIDVRFGPEIRMLAASSARERLARLLKGSATTRKVSPAEFRSLAGAALDARAAHDRGLSLVDLHSMAFDNESDVLEPAYLLHAALLRSRLRAFPPPVRPAPPHHPSRLCPVVFSG